MSIKDIDNYKVSTFQVTQKPCVAWTFADYQQFMSKLDNFVGFVFQLVAQLVGWLRAQKLERIYTKKKAQPQLRKQSYNFPLKSQINFSTKLHM